MQKHRTRENIIISLRNSVLASLRLEYFSKKKPTYINTPQPPKSKKLSISHAGSPILKVSKEKITPTFSFSSLSRFGNSIFEKFKCKKNIGRPSLIKTRYSEEKLIKATKILKINQDMSLYTPRKKRIKIEEINKNYEINKSLTQITKNEIFKLKKHDRESKLRLKFNKLEIRLNKGVI